MPRRANYSQIISFLFLLIQVTCSTEINTFADIKEGPRTFANTLNVIVNTEDEFKVALEHQSRLDRIIVKGYSLITNPMNNLPYVSGSPDFEINSTKKYAHINLGEMVFIQDFSFVCADAVVAFVQKHNFDGVVFEDLESVFYSAGRSVRDVRLLLRRVGIELHKINRTLVVILPVKSQSIGSTEVFSLLKYVDEFIVFSTGFSEKIHIQTYFDSPLDFVKNCVTDFSHDNEEVMKKMNVMINMESYMFCNGKKTLIDPHNLTDVLSTGEMAEWFDKEKEYLVHLSDGCLVSYVSVDTLKAKIEYAKQHNLGVTILNTKGMNPNAFFLF
ncbi:hypothetical protein EIN_251840 [Entamoeba invadens IP1]|uniref:Chitinase domain-containing protein 1 n=1 Tax=Entamoeba invadens IP1 TaxID=370355 RepID=A0A0A1UEJ3_ENTIV|nr:hypothetical protein EIN_251840 [Entamoeba invadens IP1]ELP95000.1 hypothetical protein EIN_251840 [Entamoeba invadens IP1]|eukprot:XP_004261771.1 hypothetical protein EIN_251840 [Entamoeba invadens IP1]